MNNETQAQAQTVMSASFWFDCILSDKATRLYNHRLHAIESCALVFRPRHKAKASQCVGQVDSPSLSYKLLYLSSKHMGDVLDAVKRYRQVSWSYMMPNPKLLRTTLDCNRRFGNFFVKIDHQFNLGD